jgi:hypothetical protein
MMEMITIAGFLACECVCAMVSVIVIFTNGKT